jgi:hypothetical protein
LSENSTLLTFQKLHGKINDFAQMFIFLKGFKYHQNKFLEAFNTNQNISLPIPAMVKKELSVWAKCLLQSKNGTPIPTIVHDPPFVSKCFISDAAGPKTSWTLQGGLLVNQKIDSGVACFGFHSQTEEINLSASLIWPPNFIKRIASHSTVFEMIGLLIPFLSIPSQLVGHNVTLYVDNIACMFAWENRICKNDEFTSILVKCLHLIESLLPCRIYVEYIPRCSTYLSSLADRCSRISTTTREDATLLQKYRNVVGGPILSWLENPTPDWDLPLNVATYVLSQI